MKKLPKPRSFRCELYMVKIHYYQKTSPEQTIQSLSRYLHVDFDRNRFDGLDGTATQIRDSEYVIWVRGNDLATLAHECLHIANMILDAKGIIPSFSNDEAQAYLMNYLINKCLRRKQPN